MEKELIEDIKLIAKFMKFVNSAPYYHVLINEMEELLPPEFMKFHSSWDWFMPVKEKIVSLGFVFKLVSTPTISGRWIIHTVTISKDSLSDITICKIESDYANGEKDISVAFKAIVEFIKWYNSQKK